MDEQPFELRNLKSEIRTGWRAIFIGLLLIPANAYWIASGEATSTTVSLFFNVIFILFVVLLINLAIKRILPNVALNQGELLIIYVMLFGLALVSALLAGYAMAGGRSRNWTHMVGLAAVMAFAVYVIIDLEFPRLGLIRVEAFDQALVDLRKTMD